MQILRMENEDGRGPFSSGLYELFEGHPMWKWEDLYPEPHEEGLPFTMAHQCGCKNARQFIHWFPRKFRKALKQEGFEPVMLEIDDRLVHEGQYQVIFIR